MTDSFDYTHSHVAPPPRVPRDPEQTRFAPTFITVKEAQELADRLAAGSKVRTDRAERRHAMLTAFAFACVLAGILLAAYLLWVQ